MSTRPIYAYMSGALTNLGGFTELPPSCFANAELMASFKSASEKLLPDNNKLVEAEQKKHYVRIKEQVCQPLKVDLYLPHLQSDPEHNSDLVPETVYYVDRLMVTSSSFIIVCLDIPSIGVGQEIEIAMHTGIPILAYKHAEKRTSRMPLGSPVFADDVYSDLSPDQDTEKVIEYHNEGELFAKLRHRIQFLVKYLGAAIPPRRSREQFSDRLLCMVERDGVHGDHKDRQLAQKLGVPPTFVAFLQKTEGRLREHFESAMPSMAKRLQQDLSQRYDFDRFCNPSLTVLRQLAHALNLTVAELIGEPQGMSELDTRIFDLCKTHHNASLREFDLVRASVPTARAFSKLDEYVAKKIQEIRSRQ
jgi:hypothetical protein